MEYVLELSREHWWQRKGLTSDFAEMDLLEYLVYIERPRAEDTHRGWCQRVLYENIRCRKLRLIGLGRGM